MRLSGKKLFSLIACLTLTVSAQARMPKKAAAPAKSASSQRMAAATRVPGKRAPKTVARKTWHKRGQQVIKPNRVREIQTALIRKSYLKGRANGVWDERSKNAMARFQSENGWQSKVVPDSRALIKLGLGPDYAGLLNPDTAVIARGDQLNRPLSRMATNRP